MDKPVLPALQKKFTIGVEVPQGEREAFMGMLDAFHSGGTQYHEAVRARAADAQQGLESLQHLYQVAQGDHGACRHVARFLLGLYNGTRYPFDLTDLRCLDRELFEHCMAVLRMTTPPSRRCTCTSTRAGESSSRWPRIGMSATTQKTGRSTPEMIKI